jgi:site-specific recombinase XerD
VSNAGAEFVERAWKSINLRHAFGSTVIRKADSREVMDWMSHADLSTTRRYLAFVNRDDAAKRVFGAFEVEPVAAPH